MLRGDIYNIIVEKNQVTKCAECVYLLICKKYTCIYRSTKKNNWRIYPNSFMIIS